LKQFLLNRRLILSLNVLLAVVFVVSVLFFVRGLISGYFEQKRALRKSASASTVPASSERRMQFPEYAPLMKNNPFGISGGELHLLTASSPSNNAQAINLVLIGTVAGPRELSYAIFKDASGVQEVFRVGESIYGMGRLYRVRKDKVLISRAGSMTEIPIQDIVKVREVRAQSTGSTLSSFAQRVGRGSYVVDQARLQQMIANPAQMMTDARLRPNTAGGREEGFVLSEVKPAGIYQSLGLQDGDVLLRINEYDISNPERALQAFTALKGLDRVQIDLIRSGARMTMTYQIK
jgi:type II secretion system protein C